MNAAPDHRVNVFITFPVSLYLEDDRVEIGKTSVACQEELTRVSYRDVRRIVTWTDRLVQYLILGGLLFLSALGFLLVAVLLMDEPIMLVTSLVMTVLSLASGAYSLYCGRAGGVTRIRIEGVRGTITGVLGGSASKRAALLAELERRVRDRRAAG